MASKISAPAWAKVKATEGEDARYNFVKMPKSEWQRAASIKKNLKDKMILYDDEMFFCVGVSHWQERGKKVLTVKTSSAPDAQTQEKTIEQKGAFSLYGAIVRQAG